MEVIRFIDHITSVPGADVFLNGFCFQFYVILKHRFPEARAWYDMDHVITEIGGRFYDASGEVFPITEGKARHLPMDEFYRGMLEKQTIHDWDLSF